MKKFKLGWILFPRRGEDFWTSVAEYRKLGYKGMELADMTLARDGGLEAGYARFHDEIGLEVISVGANHLAAKYDEAAIDKVIENAKLTNANFAGCYMCSVINPMMGREACTDDEFFQEVENLERAAERMAAAGLKLTYHNHYHEFTRIINGVSAFDQMVARTSSLMFEPDCGWVTYAGEDPIKVLDKLGSRIHAIHFKDFMPGRDTVQKHQMTGVEVVRPCFTAVGSGALDLPKCAEWAYNHDIEWCSIEQDSNNNLTSFESLQCAMFNVRETGFVDVE